MVASNFLTKKKWSPRKIGEIFSQFDGFAMHFLEGLVQPPTNRPCPFWLNEMMDVSFLKQHLEDEVADEMFSIIV